MQKMAQEQMADGAVPKPSILAHALSPNQNAAIVAMHFIAMYLELSIYWEQSLIFPYAGSTLIALIGAFANRSAVRSQHISTIGLFLFAVGIAAVPPTLFGHVDPLQFFRSYVQMIAATISGYCMFIVFILSSRRRLVQLMSIILTIIIVGSFLERFQIVRDASDAFRRLIYPKDLLYSADIRDIVSYGAIRPRFFSREPSIVGIGSGILISIIFLLIRARPAFKIGGALIVSLICIVIMRSPTIIFFTAVVCYGVLVLNRRVEGRYSWLFGFAILIALVAASFLLLYGAGLSGLSTRSILGGGSYVIRVFGPPLIWLESLRDHFFWGLGLGSFDTLLPLARQAYGAYDILALFPHIRDERDGAFLISNGFWEFWIFFGVAGGALLIFLLTRLFRQFGIARLPFPFVAWMLALQTFGGVSAYRPWHILFIFAALAFVIQRYDTDVRYADA